MLKNLSLPFHCFRSDTRRFAGYSESELLNKKNVIDFIIKL